MIENMRLKPERLSRENKVQDLTSPVAEDPVTIKPPIFIDKKRIALFPCEYYVLTLADSHDRRLMAATGSKITEYPKNA